MSTDTSTTPLLSELDTPLLAEGLDTPGDPTAFLDDVASTLLVDELARRGDGAPPAQFTDEQLVDLLVMRGLVDAVVRVTTDEQLLAEARERGYSALSVDEALDQATDDALASQLARRQLLAGTVLRKVLDPDLLAELNLREESLPEVADLGRACPFCKVRPGDYCRTSSGAPTLSHSARRIAAP